jgi:hypothetical protein
VGSAPFRIVEVLESARDQGSSEDVGKGDALSDEVSVDPEVLLKNLGVLLSSLQRV